MVFCDDCVGEGGACCDFCAHYNFNADSQGRYTGDGYCRLLGEPSDPGEVCDNFHCEKVPFPDSPTYPVQPVRVGFGGMIDQTEC